MLFLKEKKKRKRGGGGGGGAVEVEVQVHCSIFFRSNGVVATGTFLICSSV